MNPTTNQAVEARLGSLPVPLAERTWNGWVAGAVCATAAIASWSFVVGGFTAYYVDARMGIATMIAGALLGQFFVTLAQVPPTTKHGLETMATTKPQLGVRGSYVALIIHYCTLIGWNCVLMIFLGRAVGSVLHQVGVIDEGMRRPVATGASIAGVVLVWVLLLFGSRVLPYLGMAIAIIVSIVTVGMMLVLLRTHGVAEIAAAEPLEPYDDRLTNMTTGVELLMVSTLGWWAYMGGMIRLVGSARRAVLPSMISLGFAWAVVGLVSLFSALVIGEPDPTVWMTQLGGPVAGVIVLVFIAFANIGSTLVGAYSATLGVGQLPFMTKRFGWPTTAAIVLAPMVVVLIAFPGPFFDHIGTFMAFIGIMIAPILGMQIVDWFILGRLRNLRVSSLYRHDPRSHYWYVGGYNPAGLAALGVGAATYIALLNPVTLEPNSAAFAYLTASVPAIVAGGLTYLVGSLLMARRRAGHEEPHG